MKTFDEMGTLLTRRRFLGAIASTGALAGCRAFSPAGGDSPLLRIGVVSDVHFRLAKDGDRLEDGYGAETFEKALEYYRDMGVDVVVTAKTRGLKRADCDEIPPAEKPALKLAFPAATEGGVVAEYEIAASNEAGERWNTRICAVGGLYPRRHEMFARPVSAAVPLAALPAGASSVEVTPLDSFGNRGRPLVAAIARSERGTVPRL